MADMQNTRTRADQRGQEQAIQPRETGMPDRRRRRDPFDRSSGGPFSLMRRMQEDMDRLFGDVWGRRSWPTLFTDERRAEFAPAIEAFQRGNEFVVRADVPGLSREDLTVEIGDDQLIIQGERKYDHQEERDGVLRSERRYGTFYRLVPLPEGAVSESAKANFKDGVLEVVVQAPPREVTRGRRIEIQESTDKAAKP
jgi:HSP20 family protein